MKILMRLQKNISAVSTAHLHTYLAMIPSGNEYKKCIFLKSITEINTFLISSIQNWCFMNTRLIRKVNSVTDDASGRQIFAEP